MTSLNRGWIFLVILSFLVIPAMGANWNCNPNQSRYYWNSSSDPLQCQYLDKGTPLDSFYWEYPSGTGGCIALFYTSNTSSTVFDDSANHTFVPKNTWTSLANLSPIKDFPSATQAHIIYKNSCPADGQKFSGGAPFLDHAGWMISNDYYTPPSSNFTPNCLFTSNQTNLAIVPSWLGLSPSFPQNLTSYDWTVVGTEKEYYSTGMYPMWNITVPDTYAVTFRGVSNSSDTCEYSTTIPFWQNRTTPSINVSGNITPPNWSPIIPTLPTGIPILPDSLNRTHIRDQINNTILGNVSVGYMSYWDEVYEGLVDMIKGILDVIFSPLIYVLDSLRDAEAWIETITNQYSTSSANVWYFILQAIYSIHPKIANLITYELFLGLIVVVMHELKVKK